MRKHKTTSPRICLACKACLDSGEQCDCTKKEDASAGTETSSKETNEGIKDNSIIPNNTPKVNKGSHACRYYYCHKKGGSYCCSECEDYLTCEDPPCLSSPIKCGRYQPEQEGEG